MKNTPRGCDIVRVIERVIDSHHGSPPKPQSRTCLLRDDRRFRRVGCSAPTDNTTPIHRVENSKNQRADGSALFPFEGNKKTPQKNSKKKSKNSKVFFVGYAHSPAQTSVVCPIVGPFNDQLFILLTNHRVIFFFFRGERGRGEGSACLPATFL